MSNDYRHLLKPGERIDESTKPWPVPKRGDQLRAVCLFDLDPKDTQAETKIEQCVTTVTVTDSYPSLGRLGSNMVHFADTEARPLPGPTFSEWDHHTQTWGGCEYWGPEWPPRDCVPLYAIKPALLGQHADTLKRRTEAQARGIYA